jgi:hypothetical protein
MLIVPAELAQKIDDNRGEMSRSDFIEFLIDNTLKEESRPKQPAIQYATREELKSMEQDLKALLKSFLDFFLSYGIEMGKEPRDAEFADLTSKLKGLDKEAGPDSEKGRATIKWK